MLLIGPDNKIQLKGYRVCECVCAYRDIAPEPRGISDAVFLPLARDAKQMS